MSKEIKWPSELERTEHSIAWNFMMSALDALGQDIVLHLDSIHPKLRHFHDNCCSLPDDPLTIADMASIAVDCGLGVTAFVFRTKDKHRTHYNDFIEAWKKNGEPE